MAAAGADTVSDAETRMFSMASAYEQYMGRWSRLLAPAFVEFAGARNDERILDIGAGTGALAAALEAATRKGEIVGIEPSAHFVEYARKHAVSGRIRFEVGDAQSLPYADASFDRALSLLVVNFIPDHAKALHEMCRVTRPGGVVGACVWDYGAGMESLRIFWDEAVALDPAAAPKHERNMKLTHEGDLGALWKASGLADVRENALQIEQSYSSFESYWAPFLLGTGPGGAYVASLREEQRHRLETRLCSRLAGGRPDRGVTLRARAWCVRGEVMKA